MARTVNNICRFTATAGGVGPFVVSSAPAGHKTPSAAAAVNAKLYHYFAQSSDGLVFEEGWGTWDQAGNRLLRTDIFANSDDTEDVVDFAAAPTVDLFPSPMPTLEAEVAGMSSGARTLFYMAAAPLGWTKLVTDNDKALRVVSGTGGGSGGSVAFSTLFGRTQVDSHALSLGELTNHAHTYSDSDSEFVVGTPTGLSPDASARMVTTTRTTSSVGGGGGHVHGLDMRVQYLDLIICEKAAPT